VLNVLFFVPAEEGIEEKVKRYIQQLRADPRLDRVKDILPVASRVSENDNLIYYEFQLLFRSD